MSRERPPPLVAISPGDLLEHGAEGVGRFLDKARKASLAGLRGILLREAAMPDRALLELARKVREILEPDGWLAIHDRVHLASACGAQAVHLGFRSLAPGEARRILSGEVAIGFSAHEGDDLASWSSCDYLFFGPVLDTPSKRGLKAPVGFERLAAAVARSPVPVWAIGGLAPDHASSCVAAGCAGMAVRSGIWAGEDAAGSSKRFLLAARNAGWALRADDPVGENPPEDP